MKFFCPKCGEKARIFEPGMTTFFYRVGLPYFFCDDCRTIYYDKPLIRKIVSDFKKRHHTLKIPFKEIYQRAKDILDKSVKHKVEKMGYKFVRFEKKET